VDYDWDDVMMACSVSTVAATTISTISVSNSGSGNCAPSTSFVDRGPLPTISLQAAADDERPGGDSDGDSDRLCAADSGPDHVGVESNRVPLAGRDRKKRASYR